MISFVPEGYLLHTSENQSSLNPDGLRRAMAAQTVLEAVPAICDSRHDLLFDLGGVRAVMPREETVLGLDSGQAREIAILSRVGKPTCFCVTACADGTAKLSRRAAQQAAWEQLCGTMQPGDILPAVVTTPAQFGAFCDVGYGLTALLPVSRISISRIDSSAERFSPGQEIFAVLERIDRDAGRITLSHRELLGTWAENAARFSAGQTVTGIVRSVRDYGVFIELTPNLSGLAEPDTRLEPGDAVSVYIKSIQPDRQKIKLSVVGLLRQVDLPPQPLRYVQTEGRIDVWQYRPGAALTIF